MIQHKKFSCMFLAIYSVILYYTHYVAYDIYMWQIVYVHDVTWVKIILPSVLFYHKIDDYLLFFEIYRQLFTKTVRYNFRFWFVACINIVLTDQTGNWEVLPNHTSFAAKQLYHVYGTITWFTVEKYNVLILISKKKKNKCRPPAKYLLVTLSGPRRPFLPILYSFAEATFWTASCSGKHYDH